MATAKSPTAAEKAAATKAAKAKADAPPRNVYELISAIQGELAREGIGKEGVNKQQGYNFRGIDQVYNALSMKLAQHGLLILPSAHDRVENVYKTKSGSNQLHVVLKVDLTFVAISSPDSRHTVTMYGEGMDVGDKGSNKALSNAYKYAVITSFAIPVVGQDDPDANTPEAYENVGGHQVDTSTGEIKGKTAKPPEELITGQDALNIAMLVKKSGIGEAEFFKWVKAPKGDYTSIKARQLEQIINVLDERIKKAEAEAEQTTGGDNEFDDDIPF